MATCLSTCSYFLKRKGRHCRLPVIEGSVYCGEHSIYDDSGSSTFERVVCPLDHSHTVYQHLLHKHLRKCNVSKRPIPSCYVANVNCGIIDYCPSPNEKLSLSSFSDEIIESLIVRIDEALSTVLNESVEYEVLEHEILTEELCSPSNGPTALKHLKQQSSILGHLRKLNVLSSNTQYIEFGAGRGKLSHWIQLSLSHDESVKFLLIDRANCKRKFDLYHRFEDQGPKFERLLIDIEHIDLSLLKWSPDIRQVVAVSKHLCGSGTDLTLRCLSRYSDCTVAAIVIALCCHQRCQWNTFYGRELLEEMNFTATEFHIISHMTSWAVCGCHPTEATPTGYKPHPKEAIGLKCKKFLDMIRVVQLRKFGFYTKLVNYIDRDTSLENVLLIANH